MERNSKNCLISTDARTIWERLNIREQISPQDCTLDDTVNSIAYIASYPSVFTMTSTYRHNPSYAAIYNDFKRFLNRNEQYPELKQIQYPLFCKIVMVLRESDAIPECDRFIEENLFDIEQKHFKDADNFVRDDRAFEKLSTLFKCQRHIVHLSFTAAQILRDHINLTSNAELRRLLTESIIIHATYQYKNKGVPTCVSSRDDISIASITVPNVPFVSVSPTLPLMFYVDNSNTLCRVSFDEQLTTPIYRHRTQVTSLSMSKTSRLTATTDVSGRCLIYSDSTHFIEKPFFPIWCSTFAPVGGSFCMGSGDGTVQLYDIPHLKLIRIMANHSKAVTSVCFHPNCAYIGSLGLEGSLKLWDLREGNPVRLFKTAQKSSNLVFSNNGRYVACADSDLSIFEIGSGHTINQKNLGFNDVCCLHFTTDDSKVIITRKSGEILALKWKNTENNPYLIDNLGKMILSSTMSEDSVLRVCCTS